MRGPLHGIPVVIKNNIDLYGLLTTSGCRALAAAMPRADAAQVRRLRDAGAVIIAKTNMAELSCEIRSRSSVTGDVRNRFNTAVTAGGSSGGTAAAVAAGFAYPGLGTDTGGSVRVPRSLLRSGRVPPELGCGGHDRHCAASAVGRHRRPDRALGDRLTDVGSMKRLLDLALRDRAR